MKRSDAVFAIVAVGVVGILRAALRPSRRRALPPVAISRNYAPSETRRDVDDIDAQTSDVPRPGYFYTLQPGDTPLGVARRALECLGSVTAAMVVDYWYSISSSRFNLGRYGTPSTSKRFPRRLLVPGLGLGLRVAFLPRNADAIACFRRDRLPPRTVDDDGVALGGGESRGTLWFPPVDDELLADGIVTCNTYSWHDQSSTIEPDPDLMERLR